MSTYGFRSALDWCGREFGIRAAGLKVGPLEEQIGGVQSLKPLRNSHWLLNYPSHRFSVVWLRIPNYPNSAPLTLNVHKTIFGYVLKENDSVVKSVRNLDVKCEVQMCLVLFVDDANKIKLF